MHRVDLWTRDRKKYIARESAYFVLLTVTHFPVYENTTKQNSTAMIYSRRQNNSPTRSIFHSATLFFASPRCCAAAGTHAGLLFVMPSQHSVGYCRAVSLISKTAGRRPHRWIVLIESCRSLPLPCRHDAPLRSYRGLKITPRTAVRFGSNSGQCRWREHKAARDRETDSR